MERKSVKRRIFTSNALMVFVTLVIFLVINVCVIKIYSENIEKEIRLSAEQVIDNSDLEELLEDRTIHRNDFLILFGADGILCIVIWVLISYFFTKKLTDHIVNPLETLAAGAKRIRENDLTQEIVYSGDVEFENVCDIFNDMQRHILIEQEKNQKYEKARTDMIVGISHDLRTPLTAIRGTIKGLLDGIAATPEQQQRFLEAAYRRSGDMDMLLNQLFYFSKIETGNMPLFCQTVELSSFIMNYVEGKKRLFAPEKEELAVDTNGITAKVYIDPEQLQRVFDNLLENSRRYGEKLPLKMKISLNEIPGGVSICFSDNGAGVPEEKLPYLFDEFYRADESRNKKEGNGLGLYIVKYLVQSMGGNVRAENAGGFAVYMDLPLAGMKGADENER